MKHWTNKATIFFCLFLFGLHQPAVTPHSAEPCPPNNTRPGLRQALEIVHKLDPGRSSHIEAVLEALREDTPVSPDLGETAAQEAYTILKEKHQAIESQEILGTITALLGNLKNRTRAPRPPIPQPPIVGSPAPTQTQTIPLPDNISIPGFLDVGKKATFHSDVEVNGSVTIYGPIEFTPKTLILNKNGAPGTGSLCGLEVKEGGVVTGFALTSGDRLNWEFKAPGSGGVAALTPGGAGFSIANGGTQAFVITSSPTSSSTFAIPDVGSSSFVMTAGDQLNISGNKTFTNNVTIQGNTVLGSSDTDTVGVHGITAINTSGNATTTIGNPTSATAIAGPLTVSNVTDINTLGDANTNVGNFATATGRVSINGNTDVNTGLSTANTTIGNIGSTTMINGPLQVNGNTIFDAGHSVSWSTAPSLAAHLANKAYVDTTAQGLRVKSPARVVATSNIDPVTGGLLTIDGKTLVDGDRVLAQNQLNAIQNGLWVAHAGPWTRPTDYPTGGNPGASYVFITEGIVNAATAWTCTATIAEARVIGTDPTTWVLFSSSADYNMVNVGTGAGTAQLFRDKIGQNFYLKSLKNGTNVTVTNDGTDNVTVELNPTITGSTLFNGNVTIDSGHTVSWSTAPTADAQLANKAYVDATAQGLRVKGAARVVATADVAITGLFVIDGIALVDDDRVLTKNQLNAINNGLWVAHPGAWTRPTDYPNGGNPASAYVFITEGLVNASTAWVCTATLPEGKVIGVDPTTWVLFSSSATYTMQNVGTGPGEVFRNKVGQIFYLKTLKNGSNLTVTNNADDITLDLAANPTITGNLQVDGTLNSSGNLSVATNQLIIDSSTGSITVAPGATLDTSGPGTINLGTTNATIINVGTESPGVKNINIGSPDYNDNVKIYGNVDVYGTVTWIHSTDLDITDKVIRVNKGGASAELCGIEAEAGGVPAAHAKTSLDQYGWEFKAPLTAGPATLIPGVSGFTINNTSSTTGKLLTLTTADFAGARTYRFPDVSAATADFVMTAGNQLAIGGNKTFTSDVAVQGNTTLGNAAGNSLSVNGQTITLAAGTAINTSSPGSLGIVTTPISGGNTGTLNLATGNVSDPGSSVAVNIATGTVSAPATQAVTIGSTNSTTTIGGTLRLANTVNSFFAGLKAPPALAADYTLTLPLNTGTTGQVLSTNGGVPNAVLSWADNPGHDPVTIGAPVASNANGLYIAPGSQVLQLAYATTTTPGGISSTTQSFAGLKTFTEGITVAGTTTINTTGSALTTIGSDASNTIVGGRLGVSNDSTLLIQKMDKNLYWGRSFLENNQSIDKPSYSFGNNISKQPFGIDWSAMSMSSDGAYRTAIARHGFISVSTDSGKTWTAKLTDSLRDWSAIAMSTDGQYQVAVVDDAGLYISTDFGATWTVNATAGTRAWTGVAISDGGGYLTGVVQSDQIYVSADSGSSWTPKESSRSWKSVAMSGDGAYQTAVAENSLVYRSADSGTTWSATTTPVAAIPARAVSMSKNGAYQTVVTDGGQMYRSVDYGVNFTALDVYGHWSAIAVSRAAVADGQYQVATVYGGKIYESSDYGLNWTEKASARNWVSGAISGTGSLQSALEGNGSLYYSYDSGNSWLTNSRTKDWTALALSGTGAVQTGVINGGQIWLSSDSGATWQARESARAWTAVAMSTDGVYQAAVVFGDGLYLSTDSGSTWTVNGAAGTRNWTGVAISDTGAYITGITYGDQLYVSTDSGTSWTPADSARSWSAIAMSGNGQYQTAVANTDQIYVSNDSGTSWAPKDSARVWTAIAMSSNGQYQVASVSDGGLYLSTDSGATWTLNATAGSRAWTQIAISDNGQTIAGSVQSGQLYISTDGGTIWTAKEAVRAWNSIAMTSSGSTMLAAATNESLFKSTDSGSTWTAGAYGGTEFNLKAVACSADGRLRTAATDGGNLVVSTDYGQTWTEKIVGTGPKFWRAIAMSANGRYRLAAASADTLFVSTDSGENWTARESARSWTGATCSACGKYQTAVATGDQIYISSDYGSTWTARESARAWIAVASSADGKYQTALVQGGQIYTSNTFGQEVAWTARDSAREWTSIGMSADGLYQTAGTNNGLLYTSSDYGSNWTARSETHNWQAVAVSAQGDRQAAAACGGSLYTSTDYGQLWQGTPNGSLQDWQALAISSDGTYFTSVDKAGTEFEAHSSLAKVTGDFLISNGHLALGDRTVPTRLQNIGPSGMVECVDSAIYANGVKLCQEYDDSRYNIGSLWAPVESSRNWTAIATSTDGRYQVAAVGGTTGADRDMYTSSNFGSTWTAHTVGQFAWTSVASSSDGQHLIAAANNGYLYVSADFGQTWSVKLNQWPRSWAWVASSSSGEHLVALTSSMSGRGGLFASSDFGESWKNLVDNDSISDGSWTAIASSADGSNLTLVGASGSENRITVSRNYGATWTTKVATPSLGFSAVAMSADAHYQVATAANGYILVSSDYGETWNIKITDLARQWKSVSISSTGRYQLACAYGNYLWLSTDFGTNWTATMTDSVRNWNSIALSADASLMSGAVYGATLFVSKTDINSLSGNLALQNQKELRLQEDRANGSDYVAFRAPALMGASYVLTWPDVLPSAGQFLRASDGAGNLGWLTASGVSHDPVSLGTNTTGLSLSGTGQTLNFPQRIDTAASPSYATITLSNQGQLRLSEAIGGGVNYIALQAPATVAANIAYTVPDVGVSANLVVTAGAQTIAGIKTFSSGIPITQANNQLVLGATATSTSLSVAAQTAPRIYTIPTSTTNTSFIVGDQAAVQTILSPLNINNTTGAQAMNIGNATGPTTTTILGNLNINNTAGTPTINIGNSAGPTTITILGTTNINTTGTRQTTIGNATSTTRIGGPLDIVDDLITLNKGGTGGFDSGIEIEASGPIAGYVKTSGTTQATATSWLLKAPALLSTGVVTITPGAAGFTLSNTGTDAYTITSAAAATPSIYTIPAFGSSSFVMDVGTQTVGGAKTFSSAVTISPVINQLVLGAKTINATAVAHTYTIPEVGADSTFVMNNSTVAQSITSPFNINATGVAATTIGNGTAVTTLNGVVNIGDKLVTINKGGALASGTDSGIEVEENAVITGYVKTDTSGRTGWLLKAPATTGIATMTPGVGGFAISNTGVGAFSYSITSAPTAAAVYTIPTVGTSSFVMDTGNQSIGGIKTFTSGVVCNAATNQLVLGSPAATLISPATGVARVYTIPDVGTAAASFVMSSSTGTQTLTGTVNINTTGSATTTIGNAASTTLVGGPFNMTDKLITLNKGGLATTGFNSGIEIEEVSAITGYAKTSGTPGTSWLLKAPAAAGVVTLSAGVGGFTLSNSAADPYTITSAPTAPTVYTIPAAAGTSNFVMSEGTQIINGAKSLSVALAITPTSNQLVLGTTRMTTINAPTPATASRTHTIPDVGGDSSFVMNSSTVAQSITSPFNINATGAAATTIGNASSTVNLNGTLNALVNPGSTIDTNAAGVLTIGGTNLTTLNLGSANAAQTVNIATGNAVQSVNIATGTGAKIITIGAGTDDQIHLWGDVTWIHSTNLDVTDKVIRVNKGGIAATGFSSGIEVEEAAAAAAYVMTSADRNSWQLKPPATAGIVTLTPGIPGFVIRNTSALNDYTITSAPSSSSVYTIPTAAGTSNFVMSEGALTINGAKTFAAAVTVTPATNQLILGPGATTTTINAVAPAAARVYTLPDVLGAADFVLTAGTQTLTGAKTFSTGIAVTAATNQLVFGTPNTITITAPAPVAPRVYTIPDAGGASSFVMNTSTAAQTITGPININIAGAATTNIGNASSTTTISGPFNFVDKLLTLNKGGIAASGGLSGIEVEEAAIITGYARTSALRTGWEFTAPATAGVATIIPGVVGLTLSNTSATNAYTITSAPASTSNYTIPAAAGTSNFVMSEGALTINGAKTFAAAVTVTPATNQLILGPGATTTTINAVAPAAARVYTLPDVLGAADFVLTAGTQTLTGAKTFSTGIAVTAATNQLVFGTPNTITITAPAPVAPRVYTIPDAGGASSFVMNTSTAAQTITGPININIAGAATTNIGNASSTTTISGPFNFVDKLLTLNKGGIAASGGLSGIEVEEAAIITGYARTSALRTGWEFTAPATAGVATIIPGVAGLTLSNTSATQPFTITSAPTSLSVYTIPALGTGSFVMDAGTQTIGGSKTFSSTVTINPATNQLILGAGAATITINAVAPAAARVHNIPNVGINADFVMNNSTVAQSITSPFNINATGVATTTIGNGTTVTTLNGVVNIGDKLVTINKGGALASGTDSGIGVEENAVTTGYVKTDNSGRTGWLLKAPATTGIATMTPGVGGFAMSNTGVGAFSYSITSAPTAAAVYTIPTVGTSSFVMDAGNQSIGGIKTFTSGIVCNAATNQLVLGSPAATLTSPATGVARVYTIPDVGSAAASFVMSSSTGTQAITGTVNINTAGSAATTIGNAAGGTITTINGTLNVGDNRVTLNKGGTGGFDSGIEIEASGPIAGYVKTSGTTQATATSWLLKAPALLSTGVVTITPGTAGFTLSNTGTDAYTITSAAAATPSIYTIPAFGSGSFVMDVGTQTVSGAKTFSSAVTISPVINQLVLGAKTINATAVAHTYTIPEVGADSTFVMNNSTVAQSITSPFNINATGVAATTIGNGTAVTTLNGVVNIGDKLVTINKGGALASGTDSGIEVEENAVITGYVKTDNSGRTGWLLKAPATTGIATMTPGVGGFAISNTGIGAFSYSITSAPTAAAVYTIPTVGTSSFVMDAGNQSIGGIKTFTSGIVCNAATNQLVLGSPAATLTSPATGVARVYTIPDVGTAAANFVMSSSTSTQAITGGITLNATTAGATSIGNTLSTTTILGPTNINVTGTAQTDIGNDGADVVIGGDVVIDASSVTTGVVYKTSNLAANRFLHNPGTQNTFLGFGSGTLGLTGTMNTGVGYSAAGALTSGSNNTFIGNTAGDLFTTGSGNVAVGSTALTSGVTATENVAIGFEALQNATVSSNTAVGYDAGKQTTTGQFNTFVGVRAGQNLTGATAANNVAIGYNTLNGIASCSSYRNVMVGNSIAANATTAYENVVAGTSAGAALITGYDNVALGQGAFGVATDAYDNTVIGAGAGAAISTGIQNVIVGRSAGVSVSTGTNNVIIGRTAGSVLTTGTNNIYIGDAVAAGAAAEANNIRIGNASTTACQIRGISGSTSVGGVAVYVNATGVLGTATSSQRYKENIEDMGETSNKLFELRPVVFNWKEGHGGPDKDFGLIAEEVAPVYPELVWYRDDLAEGVRYEKLIPMLLNEIKKQHDVIDRLVQDVNMLKIEKNKVTSTLAALQAKLILAEFKLINRKK